MAAGRSRQINHHKTTRPNSLQCWHHNIESPISAGKVHYTNIDTAMAASHPVLNRSPQHRTQHEITIRYLRLSVLFIATLLTAYIIRHSSPRWISNSAYSQGVWRHTRNLFHPWQRIKFATYHSTQLLFLHACFWELALPSRVKNLERQGGGEKGGGGHGTNGSPGNKTHSSPRG